MNKKMRSYGLVKVIVMIFMALVFFSSVQFAEVILEKQARKAAQKLADREEAFLNVRLKRLDGIAQELMPEIAEREKRKKPLTRKTKYELEYMKELKKEVDQQISVLGKRKPYTIKTVTPILGTDKNKTAVGYFVEYEPAGYVVLSGFRELPPVAYLSYTGDPGAFQKSHFYEIIRSNLSTAIKGTGKLNKRMSARGIGASISSFSDYGLTWEELQGSRPLRLWIYRELQTSEWHNELPFNAFAPMKDCKLTAAGSAAVAQGIVMKFHGCPVSDKWSIYGDRRNSKIWYNGEYPWVGMEKCGPNVEAAALLLRRIGAILDMEYGIGKSLAEFSKCEASLKYYFGYDDAVRLIDRNQNNWFGDIKAEIDAGRPCLLLLVQTNALEIETISDLDLKSKTVKTSLNSQEHVVVIDGYRTDRHGCNELHLNMGWGGSWNWEYQNPDLIIIPATENDDANFYKIPSIKSTITGIQPNMEEGVHLSGVCIEMLDIRRNLLEKYFLNKNEEHRHR